MTTLPYTARQAIGEADDHASRATRYAIGGVGISVVVNLVHLVQEIASPWDLFTARGSAVTAEAMGGPALVFICSHLLMYADRGRDIERVPLWAGFIAGALLSSVHQWAVAYSVLSAGILAEIHPVLPYVSAGLLPVGVEGASIGSLQQSARFRSEAHDLKAEIRTAEAAAVEAERAQAEADRQARAEAEEQRRIEQEALDAQAERDALVHEAAERAAKAKLELTEATRPKSKGKPRPRKPKGVTLTDQIIDAVDALPQRPEMMPAAILAAIGWETTEANRKAAGRARDQIEARAPQPLQEVS